MLPRLEILDRRDCPAPVLAHEQITIISLGSDAPGREPMVSTLAQYALPVAGDYGVGVGSVVASVTLPSVNSAAAVEQVIRGGVASEVLPAAGPDSLYLVFGDQPLTDSWARQDAGYHSWLILNGQPAAYAEIQPGNGSGTAGHEMIEAAVDPFGGNPEVCDPFNGWTYNCHGYAAPFVQSPDGQPLVGVNTTEQQALDALPRQAFADTLFGVLALFDPWTFAGRAQAAAASHDANPLIGTVEAMRYEGTGETVAWEVLGLLATPEN